VRRVNSKLIRPFLSLVLTTSATFAVSLLALAQATTPLISTGNSVSGYVIAVHPPSDFEVNGERIITTEQTSYALINGKAVDDPAHLKDAVRPGVFVRVAGKKKGDALTAYSVLLRDDWDRKLEGFGVVDKVITPDAEPVFQADGYRIHVTADTNVNFHGQLQSLTEVSTNTWVKYSGKRDNSGELIAMAVEFFPAGQVKTKPDRRRATLNKDMEIYAKPASVAWQASLIDADGHIISTRTKVRYGDSNGVCGWHRLSSDPALQERVSRVGAKVIPLFQRELAADDPQKIFFRFYAVDDLKVRSTLSCSEGLILLPQQAIERLQNDDQLAALLADGIAFNLQLRSTRLLAEYREIAGMELAGLIAGAFVPGVDLAADVGTFAVGHEVEIRMQEQRGRMVLAMMLDAGYDPWQAPEAWRLLAPKNPSADPDLKYPNRSGYQLSILSLQYKKTADATSPLPDGNSPSAVH